MDHRITQCPRCGTSFRVTEAHLAVAAGAVRCGSCLHIFNAREHWAEEKPVPAPEAEPTQEPDLDDIVIDDDALFDDNTPLFADPASGDEPTGDAPPPPARRQEPLFNEIDFGDLSDLDSNAGHRTGDDTADTGDDFSLIEDAPEELTSAFSDSGNWEEDSSIRFGRVQDLDAELSASDEEWARDLLRDDEPLFAATDDERSGTINSAAGAASDHTLAQDGNEADSLGGDDSDDTSLGYPTSYEPAAASAKLEDFGLVAAEPGDGRLEPTFGDFDPATPAAHAAADDPQFSGGQPAPRFDEPAPAQAMSDSELDLNEEFLDIPPAHRASAPAEGSTPDVTPVSAISHGEAETIVTDASYISPATASHGDVLAAGTSADTMNDPLASLDRLATEPLQIHRFKHEPRWPGVLWGIALAVSALALVGQYAYKNFDSLARGPARPWLGQACRFAGCVLPPQVDVSQIRSGNLIVRSHPSQKGALVVDAIITNLAGFPQPYPQLQLQFSDLNGTPVAGRRFLPAEYLAGELSGAALMPVQQPVHIALELVDPGPQAVNYALTVVAPPAP